MELQVIKINLLILIIWVKVWLIHDEVKNWKDNLREYLQMVVISPIFI